MMTVAEAWDIVRHHLFSPETEYIPLLRAQGRVLAQEIIADRDIPPYNRVSMDGIAIQYADYQSGVRKFPISGIIGAGESGPVQIPSGTCVEIMTGASLPSCVDTVIPYEHVHIDGGIALLNGEVKQGQNIHLKGKDRRSGDVLMLPGRRIGPVETSIAASVGCHLTGVIKPPRVAVFSSGNELVDIHETPGATQIRRSNSYTCHALLQPYGIEAGLFHLPDESEQVRNALHDALESYDVIIVSGGISAGKFDYIPDALAYLGVSKLIKGVRQRPGKPFWFGKKGHVTVFALPGNPVSTMACMVRYVKPWLEASLGLPESVHKVLLAEEIIFEPNLTLFSQATLRVNERGQLTASPLRHQGSGDYSSLLNAGGFLELPGEISHFPAGTPLLFWSI
jgi:molybdopterin molybdotransferase